MHLKKIVLTSIFLPILLFNSNFVTNATTTNQSQINNLIKQNKLLNQKVKNLTNENKELKQKLYILNNYSQSPTEKALSDMEWISKVNTCVDDDGKMYTLDKNKITKWTSSDKDNTGCTYINGLKYDI